MNPSHPAKTPILVIEDNADQWFIIQWGLGQRFPEAEPIWKSSVLDSLFYLDTCLEGKALMPQLILLDLYLPSHTDGFHVLETLKNHHLYKEIPVIALSFSHDIEDIRKAYQLNINSYVVKPTTHQAWLAYFESFRLYWLQTATLPELEQNK